MCKYLKIILLLAVYQKNLAQNNPIFQGGIADGVDKTSQAQPSNSIYLGNIGDGTSNNNFSQAANSIFAGGITDGWSQAIVLQTTNNIFAGGVADGWSGTNYMQSGNDIFAGGIADGWSKTVVLQAGNSIFAGGISDGWSNVYYKPIVALPVKLVYFTAQKLGEISAQVSWKTSSEINSAFFEIERSSDALHFIKIGKIAAQGNSNEAFEYSFVDNNTEKGLNYYRLKQVDLNGKYEYSPARAVNFANLSIGNVKYYPNPTNGLLNIEIDESQQNSSKIINIINSSGIVVEHFKLEKNSSSKIAMDLNKLPKGIYFINLISDTIKSTQKIILN